MKYNVADVLKGDEPLTIEKFLSDNNIEHEKVAVAVNNNIIAKKKWGAFYINSNDILEIIKPTQGG